MKLKIFAIFVSVVLIMAPVSGYSQDTDNNLKGNAEDKAEKNQSTCGRKDSSLYERLKAIKAKAADSNNFVGEMIFIMETTTEKTRCYQGLVYKLARAINQSISQMEQGDDMARYQEEIYEITDSLISSTYDDMIFDNKNLSRIIENRLPLLLEDSEKIKNGSKSGSDIERLRNSFKQEMDIFRGKFLSTSRVKVGIGAALSYLPDVSYQSTAVIDLSPYISTFDIPEGPIISGPDRIRFNTSFSEKKFDSLILRAETYFFAVDLAIPDYDVNRSFSTIVSLRDLNDPGRQALHGSLITSKLEIKYDVHLRLSILDGWYFFKKQPSPQFDYGLGIGFTGMDITDKVTTNVRFSTLPGQTFEELPSGATIESSNKRSITAGYFSLFNRMKMTDSWEFGMELRSYRKESEDSRAVDVEGETLSINLIYYFL